MSNSKKFSKFGLTILPRYESGGEELSWKEMSKSEIVTTLKKLDFITPLDLVARIKSMELKTRTKKLKSGKEKIYFSKVVDFGGQLELTTDKGIPHYQMWIEVKPQCTKEALLAYFSSQVYGVTKSKSISVLVLTKDISSYKKYCVKEERADLRAPYDLLELNQDLLKFQEFLENDSEARYAFLNPYLYQTYILKVLNEPRVGRVIYWFIDLLGHAGKSLFTNLLFMDPSKKVIYVELDYDRAFKMNLADEISDYKNRTGEFPEAIVLDIPRAEEAKNLHEIYAALETILDGRVGGRWSNTRHKFTMPRNIRVFVFSNCAPELNSFSLDRWKIFALFKSPIGNDVLIQRAKTEVEIVSASRKWNLVKWRTHIETLPWKGHPKTSSEATLFFSYLINFLYMLKLKKNDPAVTPGILKRAGLERTATASYAPETVQKVLVHFDQ